MTGLIFQIVAIPLLIGLSACFVAAEYAIVMIRGSKIEEMNQQGLHAAAVLSRLKADVGDALGTIQICITATNLAIGAVAEPAITRILARLIAPLGAVMPTAVARPLGLFVGMAIVTFFTVVLSELLPKALTIQYTEKIALRVARPIDFLRVIFQPLVHVMNWTANCVTRLAGLGELNLEEPSPSESELEIMVDRADDAGEFQEEHGDLLRRAFDFADLKVSNVMIPLDKAGVIDSNATLDDLAARLGEKPYTRWPIRDALTGKITGIVNVKMLVFARAVSAQEAVIVDDLATRAVFLKPDMPLVDALESMRERRAHIAVVVDRDGRELGVVTLEDILESLVGHIPSETQRRKSGDGSRRGA